MNFRRPSRRDDDLAKREDPYNVTQASRIYFLPNLMTAGNLLCGFMAVISCIKARLAETATGMEYLGATNADHYRSAVWFILGAAAFDALDGRLARMGGRESLFGAEFDSLADVVSFGMAPAFLMSYLILAPTAGSYEWFRNVGWFIGFIYLLCAAVRLARFNVITNPLLRPGTKETNKDFVGLPVPAAAATVASLVLFLLWLQESDRSLKSWSLSLPFLMLLVAMLMVSTIRYPSGKTIDLQTKTRLRTFFLLVVFGMFVVFYMEVAMFVGCLGYLFFGLLRHLQRARASAKLKAAGLAKPV